MIIGRDMLELLKIDIKFSDVTIEWDYKSIPFKDQESTLTDFHVKEPDAVEEANDRLKRILDAKCEKANLEEICREQPELSTDEQNKLFRLLAKYESLFDGTLGTYTGSKVNLELNKDAVPYHTRAFPLPWCHMETLKVEVQRLCELGVLKRVNHSQWSGPTFVIPKKNKTVHFISNF